MGTFFGNQFQLDNHMMLDLQYFYRFPFASRPYHGIIFFSTTSQSLALVMCLNLGYVSNSKSAESINNLIMGLF